jgi:hypothetical protein
MSFDLGLLIDIKNEIPDFVPQKLYLNNNKEDFLEYLDEAMHNSKEKITMCYGLREYEDDPDADIYAEDAEGDEDEDASFDD